MIKANFRLFALMGIFTIILPFYSYAQSSVYQDAKMMAEFLRESVDPVVEFVVPQAISDKLVVSHNNKSIKLKSEQASFRVNDFGVWTFSITNPEPSDSLRFRFPDTTIQVLYTDTLTFNYFLRNAEAVELIQSDSLGEITILYAGYKNVKVQRVMQQWNMLSAHNDFEKMKDVSYYFSFPQVSKSFSRNPFMASYLDNPHLNSEKSDRWDLLEETTNDEKFLSFNKKNYPYQYLLNGDSILQLEQTVSFQEANTSYRQQIVTSQDQLTDASIKINETNKNRGALDARSVAVGLSDFIAERAQEELNLTFFNRFKQNLDKPSELTYLFPNTKKLLYDFEISNYKTLLSHARESFEVDLDNLGLNFPKILKLPKYEKLRMDPTVFNLSLIYHIADLAYKEFPVETILISGHQMLDERKKDLNKSINLFIADTLVNSIASGTNPELVAVQQQLIDLAQTYVFALDSLDDDMEDADTKLEKYFESKNIAFENTMVDNKDIETPEIQKLRKQNFAIIKDSYDEVSDAYNFLQQFEKIKYQGKIVEELKTSFYENVMLNNLKGKEYYGYLINNPKEIDYELIFMNAPNTQAEIIARGIGGARDIIREGIEKKMAFYQQAQTNFFKKAEEVEFKMELVDNQKKIPEMRVRNLKKRIELLAETIHDEITFWEKATNRDESDHYIAGLHFLRTLLIFDNNLEMFRSIGIDLEAGGDYKNIVSTYYQNTLNLDFATYYQKALNRLNFIQQKLIDRISEIKKQYDHSDQVISIKETTLSKINNRFEGMIEYHQDQFEDKLIGLELRKRMMEENLEEEMNNDSEYKVINNRLVDLNASLRLAANEEEKEKVQTQIITANKKKNEFSEHFEAVMEGMEKENSKKANTAKMRFEAKKDSLLVLQEKEIQMVNATDNFNMIPIRDIESLNENLAYQEYLQNIKDIQEFENISIKSNPKFEKMINDNQKRLKDVAQKGQLLNEYIKKIELQYCPELVAAAENADKLAQGLEIATHLLFAFRNYENVYDTLYYQDTSVVTITINENDPIAGFVNTISYDTVKISRKPIEGTTDPIMEARWLSRKEFNDLRKDETQWNIFLGLLYQRMSAVKNAPGISSKGIALLATKFFDISNNMELHRQQLRRKKAVEPDNVNFKDYYPFIRSTVDLFNTVITTPSIGDSTLMSKYKTLNNIPNLSDEALSLYENIYVKDYGNAILNSMNLLRLITKSKKESTALKNKLGLKPKKDKAERKAEIKSSRTTNAVLTYGTFMSEMINAESSNQIKNILKSATLPPGSSRIKREVVSSFTINSYLGVTVGRDRLLDAPVDLKSNSLGAALSVPIGLTYSFSPNIIKNNSSFSFHIPLIDLGAITAFRQSPDNPAYNVDNLPDFTWRNLISPGLFVVYNFANSPFSLGVGGQYGPQLRKIEVADSEPLFLNSWRFPMVFFNIDVPFFNLYTGSRKIMID